MASDTGNTYAGGSQGRDGKGCRTACCQEAAGLLSRAETFEGARAEIRRMIIARPMERFGNSYDCKAGIRFRISVEQFMRISAQGSEKTCSPGKWTSLGLLICRIIRTRSE